MSEGEKSVNSQIRRRSGSKLGARSNLSLEGRYLEAIAAAEIMARMFRDLRANGRLPDDVWHGLACRSRDHLTKRGTLVPELQELGYDSSTIRQIRERFLFSANLTVSEMTQSDRREKWRV